ncbi:MAG: OmpA family protein [Treponema sp.]|jgi:outer membrane protein OmpA-like peptidoglycan-associated protein|nr:OmpA family protein [Treponema sp.]
MNSSLKKRFFLVLILFVLTIGLSAQTEHDFPAGDFWSLNAGIGMTNFLVDGTPLQIVIDPRLWLSPPLMVGSRTGITYSIEEDGDNILTFESQVYLRWNFLRLGENPVMKTNVFFQSGLGLVAAYRGQDAKVFDDAKRTRGSLMADVMLGVDIPLTQRWQIEPSVRGGFPHIWGFSVTAGYKFPLPQKIITETRTEFIDVEVDRAPDINDAVRQIIIPAIEFVIFGADVGSYNIGIDRDAQQVNELSLNATARMLNENPNLRVRIEGHANPYTAYRSEAEDLMALSILRANVVAQQLKARGVSDEQIIIIAFGGTRTATSEWDVRNRNRRVEMMVIQFD